jgi:hypothetical protein
MRKAVLPLLCGLGAALAAASTSASGPARSASATRAVRASAVEVVRLAADSLVARHRAMPQGGWAWRSSIQAPHYQTDRDVGAAGIGAGLLAAYAVTRDPRYAHAATEAGDFLLSVAEPAGEGLRWPDWADPDGTRSATHFTSFDDGAAGISDYLWALSAATHEARFRDAAIAGMRWLVGRAEGTGCPKNACVWRWTDDPSSERAYNGLGMGQAGIVLALDSFADRTGHARFRVYARAGALRLRQLTANGERPLPSGSDIDAPSAVGFLNGSAGAASMFFERYARDRDAADLTTARRLLGRVNEHALDAQSPGFELGAAGIAWVNLQAARATGEPQYTAAARRAATWLRRVALAGGRWRESPGDAASPQHVGLDSGAAGIGWVLEEIARAGIDAAANHSAARSALADIRADASRDRLGPFWYESRAGGRKMFRAEPSWHWGSAGIAAFAARLVGWSGRDPSGRPTR